MESYQRFPASAAVILVHPGTAIWVLFQLPQFILPPSHLSIIHLSLPSSSLHRSCAGLARASSFPECGERLEGQLLCCRHPHIAFSLLFPHTEQPTPCGGHSICLLGSDVKMHPHPLPPLGQQRPLHGPSSFSDSPPPISSPQLDTIFSQISSRDS